MPFRTVELADFSAAARHGPRRRQRPGNGSTQYSFWCVFPCPPTVANGNCN